MPNGNEGALYRLSKEEMLLVMNYRLCNAERQEVMLDFSAELLKQNIQTKRAIRASGNVVFLTARPLK